MKKKLQTTKVGGGTRTLVVRPLKQNYVRLPLPVGHDCVIAGGQQGQVLPNILKIGILWKHKGPD